MRVCVSRTGYTSELGYEIYLYDATANGSSCGGPCSRRAQPHDLRVIGPCHIRRIEGGILAFGCDIWYDTNPFEVDMGYTWMVDLDQEADFIGKQALTRIKAEGPKRKLVGVEIDGPSLGSFIDNEMIDVFPSSTATDRIGSVTSACSPRGSRRTSGSRCSRSNRPTWATGSRWRRPAAVTAPSRCRSRSSTRRRSSSGARSGRLGVPGRRPGGLARALPAPVRDRRHRGLAHRRGIRRRGGAPAGPGSRCSRSGWRSS